MRVYSEGVRTLASTLKYHTKGRRVYPRGYTVTRASGDVHGWFKDLVDKSLGGSPEGCAVEENLAVFAVLDGANDCALDYANVQVLTTDGGSLVEYYKQSKVGVVANYIRLDFDLEALGPAFKEPLPHVHVQPDGSPRFHVSDPCVVAEFFDFVYRNYQYDKWIIWANEVWEDALRASGRDPTKTNILPTIRAAYNASQVNTLMRAREDLLTMHGAWRKARKEMFPFNVRTEHLPLTFR